jgi:hypothetical protein
LPVDGGDDVKPRDVPQAKDDQLSDVIFVFGD